MSDDDAERWQEQQRAWEAERARLAARPWSRKVSDALRDFSERWRWAIGLTFTVFIIAIAVPTIVLFVAWLAH